MRVCEECQKPIKGNKGKRFCSSACQQRNARKRKNGERPPKECPTCHKLFEPHNPQQVYCSDNCRPNRKISNLTPVKCAVCHEYFTPVNRFQKFCSQKCRDVEKKAKAEKKKRFCIWCGAEFIPKSVGQKYCRQQCRDAATEQRKQEKKTEIKEIHCAYCGKMFLPTNGNNKYCNKKCRDKAWARRAPKIIKQGPNREFTGQTVYLVYKWYNEGMSVDEIADLLYRSRENILMALQKANEILAKKGKTA